MAQNKRAPGADVIDIFVAVGVPNVRTLAPDDVNRITPNAPKGTHRRVHASGDKLFSALLQLAGLICFAGHYFLHSGLPQRAKVARVAGSNGMAKAIPLQITRCG